jgi:antitoxin VapB
VSERIDIWADFAKKYIWKIYTLSTWLWKDGAMPKAGIAKLFANGQSQAVRLPKEFRFEGEAVRIRRVAEGVLLQPMRLDAAEWFRRLDERAAAPVRKKTGWRRRWRRPRRA